MIAKTEEEIGKMIAYFQEKSKYYQDSYKITKAESDLRTSIAFSIAAEDIKNKKYLKPAPKM